MVKASRTRRPTGSPHAPVRTVRVEDDLWNKAKRRAAYDGVTISSVLYALVEGYAKGLLDMPKVQVIYSQPRTPQAEPSVSFDTVTGGGLSVYSSGGIPVSDKPLKPQGLVPVESA